MLNFMEHEDRTFRTIYGLHMALQRAGYPKRYVRIKVALAHMEKRIKRLHGDIVKMRKLRGEYP